MHTQAGSNAQSPAYLKWNAATEWPLFGLALVFAGAYTWQILGEPRDPLREVLHVVVVVCWSAFAVDYAVRLALARDKLRWFGRNLLLLAAVALPIFRPLRLLRVFTVFTIFQRSAGSKLRGQVVFYVIVSTALLVFIGSLAVYDAERHADGATITSFGRALWWSVVTITTVGYGDLTPITDEGRWVAAGLMVAGIALLGTVTATIAAWLVANVTERDETTETATQAQVRELSAKVAEMHQLLAQLAAAQPTHQPATERAAT